jgi:hypothetical protein
MMMSPTSFLNAASPRLASFNNNED